MKYKSKLNNWAKAAGAKTTISLLLGVVLFSVNCGKNTGHENTPTSTNTTGTHTDYTAANNAALEEARKAVGGLENVENLSDFAEQTKAFKNNGPIKSRHGSYILSNYIWTGLRELVYNKGIKNDGVVDKINGALTKALIEGTLFGAEDETDPDHQDDQTKYVLDSSASIQFIEHALLFIKTLKEDVFKKGNNKATVNDEYRRAKQSFYDGMEKVTSLYAYDWNDWDNVEFKKCRTVDPNQPCAKMPDEVKKAVDCMLAEVQKIYDKCIQALKP